MKRWLPILTCVPPAFLAVMFLAFSTDVPYLDQWEFVPFLKKAMDGTLAAADFWAQHNEHRIVFPRAIMLAMTWLTHWDIRAELAINFLLGAGVFALMLWQVLRATDETAEPVEAEEMSAGERALKERLDRIVRGFGMDSEFKLRRWIAPILSLLCFSLAQWTNWFLGWQLQLWLAELATLGAVALLLGGPNALRFAAALLLGTIATYSFANGMLAWPLGFAALMLAPRRAPVYQLFVWSFAGSIETGLYLTGYHAPSYHPAPGAALLQPELFFKYVTIYLGQPIMGFSLGGAGVAGLLGVLVWLWAAMFWRAQVLRPAYAVGLLWPAYSIANALLTAYARAPLGVEQALSPRYATLAIPFWAGLLVLCIYARAAETRNHLIRMLCFLIALSSLHGAYRWTERYHVYERAKNDLIAGDTQADLHWLYPDANVLRERSAWLRAHGLSVFRAHDR